MKRVFFILMALWAAPVVAAEKIYEFEAFASYGQGEFPEGTYATQFKERTTVSGVLRVPSNEEPDALSGGGHYIEEFASYEGSVLTLEGVDEPLDVIMTVGDATRVDDPEWVLNDTVTFARTFSNSDYEVGIVLNLVYPGPDVFEGVDARPELDFSQMEFGEFTVHYRQRAKAGVHTPAPSAQVFSIVRWKEVVSE